MKSRRPLVLCVLSFLVLFAEAPDSKAGEHYCTATHASANDTVVNCHELKVVYLRGTPEERARAYGSLFKDKILDSSVIDYFANRMLLGLKDLPKPLRSLADSAFTWWAGRRWRVVDPAQNAEVAAMAEAMGVKTGYLQRAMLLPDLSNYLNAYSDSWPLTSLPPMGCTSVAKRTGDSFYYGRNLDFASTGLFDKFPLILVHLPAEGSSELRHISFGAHGLFFAGITGVNEAGITFAVHQNQADVRKPGLPMPLIGELVLRSAKTLEDAIALLEKYRPGPFWTFVVTDLKTGTAAAVESSAGALSVRRMTGPDFVQTNHLQGDTTTIHEFSRSEFHASSRFRYDKASLLLHTDGDMLFEFPTIFRILAYTFDPRGELNSYSDIMKPNTIQTLIFEAKPGVAPTEARLHFSVGEAPTATGLFLSFRIGDLLTAPAAGSANPFLTFDGQPAIDPSSEARKNQMAASRAQRLYFDEQKPREAIAEVALQTSLSARLFQATASYQLEEFEKALTTARGAIGDPAFAQAPAGVRDSLRKPELLSLVALKRDEEAKQVAQAVLGAGTDDAMLLELTQTILAGDSIPLRLRKISYDFFSGNLRTKPVRPR